MESFRCRLIVNLLIALFILLVPLLSGNPITWWNVGGAVAVLTLTFLTRTWYTKPRGGRQDADEQNC
jgi:dolichyl-phosphate-mannose--protein O-mannosyl transferase